MRKMTMAFIWIGYKRGVRTCFNICLLAAMILGAADFLYDKNLAQGILGTIVLYFAVFLGTLVGILKGRHLIAGLMVTGSIFVLVAFLSSFTGNLEQTPTLQIIIAMCIFAAAAIVAFLLAPQKGIFPFSRFFNSGGV